MTEIVAAHLERVAREWLTASNGERFYVSPDGNWLIWETRSPTAADEAHRGLAAALAACAREATETAIQAFGGCLCTCDETPHRRVCNVVIATNLRERAVGEKGQ